MSNRWKGGFIQAFFDPLNSPPPSLPGELFAWGNAASGMLGDGTVVNKSSPIQIGTSSWAVSESAVKRTFGITDGGKLYSWGQDGFGALGQNTNNINRSSPTQVGALTTWLAVSGGGYHAAAVKTDGTLWAWGYNVYGQLGNNATSNISSPTQVGALTTWLKVCCGAYNTFAIKTNGTLWAWGANSVGPDCAGVLGQNDAVDYSSPVQIGALTDWAEIFSNARSAIAIKTDGTLWAIGGNNAYGTLGQNNAISKSSPVQIGALTNWQKLSTGGGRSIACSAIKTDGTLWTWGYNNDGMLGISQNNANPWVSVSSPIQVGSLTDWYSISIGRFQMMATKTDDTLWGWGNYANGRLGNNVGSGAVNSPIQIGAETYWGAVSTGEESSTGIKKV